MATRTPRNYAIDSQLSSSASDIVPVVLAGVQAVVRKLSFYNSGATARAVTVYIVASAGTADTGTTLVVKTIQPSKTWNVAEIQGEVLEIGQKVQASQDTGTDVNANCSGSDVS
jgi:hypothetical protein